MKPKPLDFATIDDEIIDELNKKQPHDLQTEIDVMKQIIKQHIRQAFLGFLEEIKNITTFVCYCNCADFENGKCAACGSTKYRYAEVDYDELMSLIKKWFADVVENDDDTLNELLKCPICGTKFKQVDKHIWKPNCKCFKKDIRVSVG